MKIFLKSLLFLIVLLFPWSITVNEQHADEQIGGTLEVKVTNNYNKEDTIEFNNLKIGSQYYIYSDSALKNELKNFKADSSKKLYQ